MFTVLYLCTANPARPQWREDTQLWAYGTDNYGAAVGRAQAIIATGRQAVVMRDGVQVYPPAQGLSHSGSTGSAWAFMD